ncbi:hypothetical protein CLOHAE12215_01265 [Clostridium haemolyticum]|uniref:S1 family peptidase n=1 Tax=Clostridium haemolyticum TaxID=84025 RepID=UPI001C3BC33C|nr:S1 family peptidase [Clostridium haemolyticum]CAG7839850.1 hypothetical protein CLOHAE12215_01265 [Clostridium haemolyticum]
MNQENLIENGIRYICNSNYEYFLRKKNVQGIGLGYKKINGKCTFRKCISVFVSKKLSSNNIAREDLIPSYFNCIPTDVVETGIFTTCALNKRIRPVQCGYSIGPVGVGIYGTLGCLVRNRREKAVYVLSASHALNPLGKVSFGTPIVQPGVLDGGSIRSDVIANLIRSTNIQYIGTFSKPVNTVDAAIAKVSNISIVSTTIAIVGKDVKEIASPKIGEKVFKVGRTTGFTEGSITETDVTQIINSSGKKALFKNQIAAGVKSDNGDSGSVLLNSNMNPIGLLMGTSQSTVYSVFNDMKNVTLALNVEVITRPEMDSIKRMYSWRNNVCV